MAAIVAAAAGGLLGGRGGAANSPPGDASPPGQDAPVRALAADPHAPAAATTPPAAASPAPPPPPQQRFASVALDTRQLMADVAIARLALGAELVGDARDHVQAALPIAERLVAAHAAGDPRWLPLQDEERVVRTLDDSLARRHEQPLLAAEAHAVRTHRELDPRIVLAKLRVADEDLAHGDAFGAAAALEGADASVVAETNVRDLPLERVHDNLVLARELAQEHDYPSAVDALGYARAALADAELADGTLRNRPVAAQLRREIAALQAQLGSVEPAGLHALQDAVQRWWAAAVAWVSPRR